MAILDIIINYNQVLTQQYHYTDKRKILKK